MILTSNALHDRKAVSKGSSWKASGPQCFNIWATPRLCIKRRSPSMANYNSHLISKCIDVQDVNG